MKTRVTNRNDRLEIIQKMLFKHVDGLRVVEIARACGVDRRTIYRDLTMLQERDVPISQKNGRFLINREYYSATTRLNVHESTALVLALRLAMYNAEQVNPHLISILQKMSDNLPGIAGQHIAHLVDNLRKVSVDRGFMRVLETVNRAWTEERFVEVWYHSSKKDRTVSREFAPYFIEMSAEGKVYVVGYDALTKRIRTLKLRRIMRARLLRHTFEIPAQFDPQHYLTSMWGEDENDSGEAVEMATVIVRLSDSISARVLHQRRSMIDATHWLDDGRCEVTLRCYRPEQLLPWIRSLGRQIEVVSPEFLRQTLADDADFMRKLYHSSQDSQHLIST